MSIHYRRNGVIVSYHKVRAGAVGLEGNDFEKNFPKTTSSRVFVFDSEVGNDEIIISDITPDMSEMLLPTTAGLETKPGQSVFS